MGSPKVDKLYRFWRAPHHLNNSWFFNQFWFLVLWFLGPQTLPFEVIYVVVWCSSETVQHIDVWWSDPSDGRKEGWISLQEYFTSQRRKMWWWGEEIHNGLASTFCIAGWLPLKKWKNEKKNWTLKIRTIILFLIFTKEIIYVCMYV